MMKKIGRMRRCLAAIVTVVLVGSLLQPLLYENIYADENVFGAMRQKWCDVLTGGENDTEDTFVRELIAERDNSAWYQWQRMKQNTLTDRLFPDQDIQNFSSAMTGTYTILRDLAIAYQTRGGRLYHNQDLKVDLVSALDFMYNTCYNENTIRFAPNLQSETNNWWDWEIGSAQKLNDITVLLYDDLSEIQRKNYMNAINFFVPDPKKYYYHTGVSTGANRVSAVLVTALQGVISKKGGRIAESAMALSDVFLYVQNDTGTRDGFYEDGSFIQHGSLAYNGGYGLGLISDISDILYLLEGTEWEIKDSNAGNVYHWMYHSFEPFVNSGMMMDTVNGRQITRPYNKGNSAITLLNSAVMLSLSAEKNMARDLRSMAKMWAENKTAERQWREWNVHPTLFIWGMLSEWKKDDSIPLWSTKTEYRQYTRMDRALYRQPEYAFAVSMSSERISRYEALYGENAEGWHTGDGMTYLYNADETAYADAFWPTVDRYRLPGITVAANVRHTAEEDSGNLTPESQVGGVQLNNRFGASCMRLNTSDGVRANKSWFMFGDEVVALGSDITAANSSQIVETVAENRKLDGEGQFILNGIAKPTIADWEEKISGVRWAHLAGQTQGADIGYYFPEESEVNIKRETRKGEWSATKPVQATYQTMWFEHSVTQEKDKYAYVLLPGVSVSEMESYAANPNVKVLCNNADVQAVLQLEKGLTAAIFWTDKHTSAGGITSNRKAAVMMQEAEDELTVSVSDPTQKNTGKIEIELAQTGEGVIAQDERISVTQLTPTVKFTVDCAGLKGDSVTVRFSKPEYRSKTLLELKEAMCVSVQGNDSWVQECGGVQLRCWALGSAMHADGICAGGYDRFCLTQKTMSWYKDHILLNQQAVAADVPLRIEIRFRVNPSERQKQDLIMSALRLCVTSDSGKTEVEIPAGYCQNNDWHTAVFILDPKEKQLSGTVNGVIKRTSLPQDGTVYQEMRLYLSSRLKNYASADIEQDGILDLKTSVNWEIDSLTMRDQRLPFVPVFDKVNVWRADNNIHYQIHGTNTGVESKELICFVALKDENERALHGDVHHLGTSEPGEIFRCTGVAEEFISLPSRNFRLEFYLWEAETMRPYDWRIIEIPD